MADDILKHSQYWELLLHSGSSHKLTALYSVCAHPTQSETRQAKILTALNLVYFLAKNHQFKYSMRGRVSDI